MQTLDEATAQYHTAVADVRFARERFYKVIKREHKRGMSGPELARQTGLTAGRIGQILRGE